MRTNSPFSLSRSFYYLAVAALLLLLAGCAGFNRIVSVDNRIPLVEGESQQGIYAEDGSSLEYRYDLSGDIINLEGEVYPGRSLNWLKVRLLFLDGNGAILQSQNIYYSGYRSFYKNTFKNSFSKNIRFPNGTTDISFDFYVEQRIRR